MKNLPSPATILASLALFVALGGTGYAATHGFIITNAHRQVSPHALNELRGKTVVQAGATGATGPEGRLVIETKGPRGEQGPKGGTFTWEEIHKFVEADVYERVQAELVRLKLCHKPVEPGNCP